MSTVMKKPKTPMLNRVNQRKYSLFISQETKAPVKTITAESRSIATEMPSTPTEYLIWRDVNQSTEAVKSICASAPAARSFKNRMVVKAAKASSKLLPTTITVRMAFCPLDNQSAGSIRSGISTNNDKKFIFVSCLKDQY